MRYSRFFAAIALIALAMPPGARAFDDAKYPNFKGQWNRRVVPGVGGQPSFDQTKSWAFGQQAPLTAEYTKVLEDSLAEQAKGGQGNFTGYGCLAFGMPLMMIGFYPQEYVVTPEATHIIINNADHVRRIYTDGREWPKRELEPTYAGYSIGQWIDEDGDGKYNVLEIETRGPFKGPRVYDGSGLPLDHDNQSIFKERIFLDKADPNVMHNVTTVIDHALTRPWTVDRLFLRNPNPQPAWPEYNCSEDNQHVQVGSENHFLSGDGYLMPAHKDQPPPDLRYFKKSSSN